VEYVKPPKIFVMVLRGGVYGTSWCVFAFTVSLMWTADIQTNF